MFPKFYVSSLGALVASGEQHDQLRAMTSEVGSVASAIIDAHFQYTLADRLDVAGITQRQAINPDQTV